MWEQVCHCLQWSPCLSSTWCPSPSRSPWGPSSGSTRPAQLTLIIQVSKYSVYMTARKVGKSTKIKTSKSAKMQIRFFIQTCQSSIVKFFSWFYILAEICNNLSVSGNEDIRNQVQKRVNSYKLYQQVEIKQLVGIRLSRTFQGFIKSNDCKFWYPTSHHVVHNSAGLYFKIKSPGNLL